LVALMMILMASAASIPSLVVTVSAADSSDYNFFFTHDSNRLFDTDGDGDDDTIALIYSIDLEEEDGTPCTCTADANVRVELWIDDTHMTEINFNHEVTGGVGESHTQFLTAPYDGEYDIYVELQDDDGNWEDEFEYEDLWGDAASDLLPNIVEIDLNWYFTPYDNRALGGYVNALNDTMYIVPGETVVWVHNTGYSHTVTSYDGTFDSGGMNAGDAYRYTFNTAGTYDYSCTYHNMQGTIVVMEPMVMTPWEVSVGNEVDILSGDFLEYDEVAFTEFMVDEFSESTEWDSVEVNWVRTPIFEAMPFIGPNGVSDDGESCPLGGDCHVLNSSFAINMTMRNSDDGRYWVINFSASETMYLSYPFDGSEYEVTTEFMRMWHGDQSSGEFYRTWEWNNNTEEVQTYNSSTNTNTGGIPTSVSVGDQWRYSGYYEEIWTYESCEQYFSTMSWGAPQCTSDYDNTTDTRDEVHAAVSQKPITIDYGNSADSNDSGPTTFVAMEVWNYETCVDCDFEETEPEEILWYSEWGFPLVIGIGEGVPLTNYSIQYFVDNDDDGVPDVLDQCPSTPAGAVVDDNGCSWGELDDDDDGILNQDDDCPGTTAEMTDVDENGCAWEQRDDDGDGVMNPDDQCQGTDLSHPVYTIPPNTGCSDFQLDDDGDTVSNAEDTCPGFDDLIDVDGDGIADGCDSLVDSDGDGVADADDLCEGYDDSIDVDDDGIPDGCDSLIDSDRDDVADSDDQCPGYDDAIDVDGDDIIDGCDDIIDSDGDGVADSFEMCPGYDDAIDVDADGTPDGCDSIIDSDFDFVADGDDECPDTESAEVVNENGCSPAQLDTDSDGVNDAEDRCPVTPGGTHDADADGCPDDIDGDGILDVDDDCAGSSADEQVDTTGCVPDTSFLAGGFSGDNSILLGGLAALLVSIILLVTVMIVRRGRESEEYKQQSELFEEVSTSALKWSGAGMPSRGAAEGASMPTSGAPAEPSSPHVAQVGEVQADGYEYLEHPPNSDNWWYRDQQTNHWQRWVK